MLNVYDRITSDFTADRIVSRDERSNLCDVTLTRLHVCKDALAREYAREVRTKNTIARVAVVCDNILAQLYVRDENAIFESENLKISTSAVEDVARAQNRDSYKTIADVQMNTCTVYFDTIMHVYNHKTCRFEIFKSARSIEYDRDFDNSVEMIAKIADDACAISNECLRDMRDYKRLKRKIAILKYFISQLIDSKRDEDVKKKFAMIAAKKKCEKEIAAVTEKLNIQ